ncbi:ATP-binding protein [Bremerella sp. T1]|uniref:ATP-binding response regulator n=1 Tax=Bremerella sp. TYQ1 TaxID=3119568 RepID=UPI001CCBF88D|nr:response regulator [Bremerella volcania]UBM36553.1 response regulator [Bremerella volcania]
MPTILIVDDTPVDLHLIEAILKKDPANGSIAKASHGMDALEKLHAIAEEVDLVVTDLNMPEMNGLELVTRMQTIYPEIPVILTTAHGSEQLAVQALEQGAACYVPKGLIAERLLPTVQQVRAMGQAEKNYERLTNCMKTAEFTFELENEPVLFERLVEMLQQICGSLGICEDSGQVRLGMALEGALFSACYRGNLELSLDEIDQLQLGKPDALALVESRRMTDPYQGRRVRVTAKMSPKRAEFEISFDGAGIDPASIPDPNAANALDRIGNRGLVLMQAFMDEFKFDEVSKTITIAKVRSDAS